MHSNLRVGRRGLISILALTLVACATPNIGDRHDVRGATATGVISGSITYEGPGGAYRIELTSKATGETYRVQHGDGQTLNLMRAFKGEDPNPGLKKRGSPFAAALPVGRYEITSWHISSGAAHIDSTAPTGVSFEVEAGQAIYLGNFHFRETSRVVRLITGAAVTLSDQASRDLGVIRDTFPALASVPITQSLNPAARVENFGGDAATRIDIPIFLPLRR